MLLKWFAIIEYWSLFFCWITKSIFAINFWLWLFDRFFRIAKSIITFNFITWKFLASLCCVCSCAISDKTFWSYFWNSCNDSRLNKTSIIVDISYAVIITISNKHFYIVLFLIIYRINTTWLIETAIESLLVN